MTVYLPPILNGTNFGTTAVVTRKRIATSIKRTGETATMGVTEAALHPANKQGQMIQGREMTLRIERMQFRDRGSTTTHWRESKWWKKVT